MTKPTKPGARGNAKPANKATGTPAGGPSKSGGASTAAERAERARANRVQSKKIVNKRQTPWGLIIATVLVVVLAVGVIGYAVSLGHKKKVAADPAKIAGIQHYTGLTRNHVTTVVTYPQSPPVGGDHSPIWADCTGTVYPAQIANENAVHTLEHGAIWITYKPGLAADQLDILTKLVSGNQFMLLTPYAGLKTNVSLQAWGYQLFVDSASDPRIATFIEDLKLSQSNTPELGASCDNPTFKSTPSTPGHPTEQ
ncbi:MAG: uncharacterized protein JWN95_1190 [Frankiales bacterium]|nr:uncharacterized protein [Frankiales bacterium]